MDKKNKKLECPFTWDIDEYLASEFIEMEEPTVDIDEEPLLFIIISIAFAYFISEKDKRIAIKKLKGLDYSWKKIDKSQLIKFEVSVRVLFHVKEATKFFIFKMTDREAEAECILENLESAEHFCSPSELATINGCKSIVWSNFHRKAHERTIEFARLAISGSPNCPLWYYVLGKALRHVRGDDYHNPVNEEEECVLKSCQLLDTPFYKIRLAQIFREKKQSWKARSTYSKIYEANPKGQDILLRLARAFTIFRDYEKAKVCFDRAEEYPKNTMYHHHKGLFFLKIEDYEQAAFHFQKATSKIGNYQIRLLLGHCLSKLDENFDFINYLKSMLENCSMHENSVKYQLTLLHIAMNFHYKKDDAKNTAAYLLKAIEFDPQCKILESFGNTTLNRERLNIYDFTQQNLQEFQNQVELMEGMKEIVEKLDNHCQEYQQRRAWESLVE